MKNKKVDGEEIDREREREKEGRVLDVHCYSREKKGHIAICFRNFHVWRIGKILSRWLRGSEKGVFLFFFLWLQVQPSVDSRERVGEIIYIDRKKTTKLRDFHGIVLVVIFSA